MSKVLFACLFFFGCSASHNEAALAVAPTALVGDARRTAQAELRARGGPFDFHECVEDSDCIASRFHDCCTDAMGVANCEWWAVRADQVRGRELMCGVVECVDGSAYCFDPNGSDTTEAPGQARCAIYRIGDYVDGACELSGAESS